MPRRLLTTALLVGLVGWAAAACGDRVPPRDLRELVVRDSTYHDPATLVPYTGPVFRPFADEAAGDQVVGELVDGTWHGEFTVYWESGRVRYMGRFESGERCGAWTENADDVERESLVAQVRAEIETLGLYPPCPERESTLSIFELAILALIFFGFLGLIAYVAQHARSDDE